MAASTPARATSGGFDPGTTDTTDLSAEHAVVSLLVWHPELFPAPGDAVPPDHFAYPHTRAAHQAVRTLRADGQPVNATSVWQHVTDHIRLDALHHDVLQTALGRPDHPVDARFAENQTRRLRDMAALRAIYAFISGFRPYNARLGVGMFQDFAARLEDTAPIATPPDAAIVRGVTSFPVEPPLENILLGDAWLRTGDVATLVSSAGAGKSVGMNQAAIAWSLGLPYFGIAPPRALRVLLFSGEDDEVTLGECREGFLDHAMDITGVEIPRDRLATLDASLRTDFSRAHTGLEFHARLDRLLTAEPADLVMVNPLFSYVGGDLVEHGSDWFRCGLMPLLTKHRCGALVAAHTVKLAKDGWETVDDTYSAFGGAEMANIPRAILTLRPTAAPGLHVLRVSKRQTTGWLDEHERHSTHLFLRRSGDPRRPAWLPVTHEDAADLIKTRKEEKPDPRTKRVHVSDVIHALAQGPATQQALYARLEARCGIKRTAARDIVRAARMEKAITVLSEEPSPRGGKPTLILGLPATNGQTDPDHCFRLSPPAHGDQWSDGPLS